MFQMLTNQEQSDSWRLFSLIGELTTAVKKRLKLPFKEPVMLFMLLLLFTLKFILLLFMF